MRGSSGDGRPHTPSAPPVALGDDWYGAGLQLLPGGRTAWLVRESGVLVATGDTAIDDDVVFGLIDTGRR